MIDWGDSAKRCLALIGGFCCAVLLCLLSCVPSAFAQATTGEPMYMISQSELDKLSTNLTILQTINAKSQTELENMRSELETSRKELTEAKRQSAELKNQLDELVITSKTQENSLRAANESLKQYAKEEQRTRLRLKAQRNGWETVAACLLVAWISK